MTNTTKPKLIATVHNRSRIIIAGTGVSEGQKWLNVITRNSERAYWKSHVLVELVDLRIHLYCWVTEMLFDL